jgi:organic radical activating enzyme
MVQGFRLGTDNPVLKIKYLFSTWCNYACSYCTARPTNKRPHRYHTGYLRALKNPTGKNNSHSFDNYPVERWLDAFSRIPSDYIVDITGGEPFLDAANFDTLLEGLTALDKCLLIKIDTNGSWKAENHPVGAKVTNKTVLNVSYHPTQTAWDVYTRKIDAIFQAGWKIAMINYVMEERQRAAFETVSEYFHNSYGLFVNPNPNSLDYSQQQLTDLARYFPELDLEFKVARRRPAGRRCYYPAICWLLEPTGEIGRACVRSRTLDFLKRSEELTPLVGPSICRIKECFCLDMYAFLEHSGRAKHLDLHGEYVESLRAHARRSRRRQTD